jgi:TATA-binding protein-associated factor Taf7
MSDEFDEQQAHPVQEPSFLSAWEKRKQDVLLEKNALENQKKLDAEDESPEVVLPTDEDMPPVESLTEDSDYTGFLSPDVSESLRKVALRKLFQSAEFNICDGLDNYDGDYTSFEKLGNIITSDLKHQMEVAARKKAEKDKEALEQDEAEALEQDEAEALEQDEIEALEQDEAEVLELFEEASATLQIEQRDLLKANAHSALPVENKEKVKLDNDNKNKQELDGENSE